MHNLTDIPTDSLSLWCQLAPQGSFTRNRPDGTPCLQLLDAQAHNTLVTAFNTSARDVLLDFEHSSETTADSRAAGWIIAMRSRAATLEALIRFTPEGAAAVRNRSLRYLSPVWQLGPDNRPLALISAGLTNVPYFNQLRPVLNKAVADQPQQPTKESTVKELALMFGLPEDASEADILAAIKKYKEEQEAKAVATAAEAAAVANSAKIGDKAAFIKAYILNKDAALAAIAAAKAPVCNKEDARPPSFAVTAGAPILNRAEFNKQLATLPPSKRQAFYDDNSANVTD